MARQRTGGFANDRAVEIYKWALTQSGKFRSRDIPGYSNSGLNKMAISALVDRDLIRIVSHGSIRYFKLSRIVDPATCLDVPDDGTHYTGVVRYRVQPWIAARYGGASNLRQYSI